VNGAAYGPYADARSACSIRWGPGGANRAMAQFNRQYLGKPVSTVKPALKRVWEQRFDKIDDRKLTEYAKLVSEGTRPLVRHRLARGERGDSVGVHAPDRPGVLGMGTDAP
jgi:hypothetical protein